MPNVSSSVGQIDRRSGRVGAPVGLAAERGSFAGSSALRRLESICLVCRQVQVMGCGDCAAARGRAARVRVDITVQLFNNHTKWPIRSPGLMPVPAPIHPVTTVAALEQALEDRILDGDLPPGAHLREAELTRDYDVARHSLRAACDGLARRGLLTKRVNRGFFVPELTAADAADIFELRRALELPVVRGLAGRKEIPAATATALAAFEAMPAQAAWRDIVRTDVDFHRGLVEAAGNGRLTRAHADLLSEIALCIVQTGSTYDDAREVAREHRDLTAAIRSGDPDRAERELDAHFAEGLRRLPFPDAATMP